MVSWKLADGPALVGARGFSRVDRLQHRALEQVLAGSQLSFAVRGEHSAGGSGV